MIRPFVLSIVFFVTILDQATKYFADTLVEPARPVKVLPFFHLVNVKNTGAAFGLLGFLGNWFFVGVSVLAVIFIVYLLVRGRDGTLGLSLVLSGAVGNLIDRLAYGYVRDFLDFSIGSYHWPAFNVADSALSVGLVILLLGSFMKKKGDPSPDAT